MKSILIERGFLDLCQQIELKKLDTLKRNLLESDSREASFILVWRLHAWISQAHMSCQFDPLIYEVLSRILSQESTRVSYGSDRSAKSGASLNGKAKAIVELKQALNGSYITPFPNHDRYRLNNLLKSIHTETSPRQLLRLLETAEQDLDYVKSARALKFIKKSEIEFIETAIIITATQIEENVYDEMKMLGLKQLLRNYPSKKPYRPKPSETLTTTSNTLQLTANSATIAKEDKLHLECLFLAQEEEAQSLFANSPQSFFKRKHLNINKSRGSTAVIQHHNKKSM
ncbi:hypothetical protein ACFORL_04505 [Legionella dresdenensis]|uniref:Uncharacterized protein n=1 Tax=Legionella dresdenensis TaxID=450200 RepID=A0ABV8CDE3_9GAMM